jgi:hypothetical protein
MNYLIKVKSFFEAETLNNYKDKIMKSRTTGILAIFFIMAVLFCNVASASYPGKVGEYQDDYSSRGYNHDSQSNFNSGIGTTYSVNNGAGYQPLVFDLDNSGIVRLIGTNGNYIQLRDQFGNLVDEYNMGGSASCQPSISDDFNGDGFKELNIVANSNFTILQYNGTWQKIYTNKMHSGFGSVCNGIKCLEYAGGKRCYMFSGAKSWYYSYNISAYYPHNDTLTGMNAVTGVPAIGDLDNDGIVEQVIRDDADVDGNYGFRVVRARTFQLICNVDDLAIGVRMANPVTYNIDGAGQTEIFVHYVNKIAMYKPDCTLAYPALQYDSLGGDTAVSNPVILTLPSTSYPVACAYESYSGSVNEIAFGCIKGNGDTYNKNRTTGFKGAGTVTSTNTPLSAFGADINADGWDELITPSGAYELVGVTSKLLNLNYSVRGKVIVADLNGDNENEVIFSNSTMYKLIYSSFTNEPPVFNTRSIGQNYASPLCPGTTLTFSATECVVNTSGYPCHYTNDRQQDTERLVSDCGNPSAPYTNGTFVEQGIQVSCLMNTMGGQTIKVYLQDQSNKNTYAQYKTISMTVINGTPGFTCNLAPSSDVITGTTPGTPPAGGTLTSSDIQTVTDTLTGGGSTFIKLLLVLAFTIALMAYFASWGIHNPIIYAMGVFAEWMIFAMLGFLSWIYVIIFAFVIIGAAAVFFVKGNSQGQ